jgi:hypothetical protein
LVWADIQATRKLTHLILEGGGVVLAHRLRVVGVDVVVAHLLFLVGGGGGAGVDVRRAALVRSAGGRADAKDPTARVLRARGQPGPEWVVEVAGCGVRSAAEVKVIAADIWRSHR